MSEEKKQEKAALTVGQKGQLQADSAEGLYRIAALHLQGGMLPKHYRSPEQVMSAMQFAKELGLQPLTALKQIAVINGNPSLYGDLPLALVTQSKDFEYIREYLIDSDMEEICPANKNLRNEVFGAVCVTKRKSAPHEHTTWFTMEDKDKANLNGPVWKSYTRTMLKYRARSANLKDNFPECLNGVTIAEYDFNTMPTVEGQVIDSVQHNGQRSRMEEIRQKFIEHKPEGDNESTEAAADKPNKSSGAKKRKRPAKRKAAPVESDESGREQENGAAEVGGETSFGTDGEMPGLWPTD